MGTPWELKTEKGPHGDRVPQVGTHVAIFAFNYKFGHQMAPLTLVVNLATRWRHLHWLQIWPPDGATCMSYKFGHQMAQLEMVTFSV